MKLWRKYDPNVNPDDDNDCTVRAICAVMGWDWDTAYTILADRGFQLRRMPSSDKTWGSLLRDFGFRRMAAPYEYTVRDFCEDHPDGRFFVCPDNHVAAVIDGQLWDSWNCLDKEINTYWEEIT